MVRLLRQWIRRTGLNRWKAGSIGSPLSIVGGDRSFGLNTSGLSAPGAGFGGGNGAGIIEGGEIDGALLGAAGNDFGGV